jgi:hypothetical protein
MAVAIVSIDTADSIARPHVPGARYQGLYELTGDSSYPAGGYPLTAASFGLNVLEYVIPVTSNGLPSAAPVVAFWTQSTGKLFLLVMTTGLETAADMSTLKVYLLVVGN